MRPRKGLHDTLYQDKDYELAYLAGQVSVAKPGELEECGRPTRLAVSFVCRGDLVGDVVDQGLARYPRCSTFGSTPWASGGTSSAWPVMRMPGPTRSTWNASHVVVPTRASTGNRTALLPIKVRRVAVFITDATVLEGINALAA